MTTLWSLTSHDEAASLALGRRLGAACRGGEIILLEGPLGAGKTRLAGGIAAGLGVARPVISPTYLLLRSYECHGAAGHGLTLHHLDFYRLEGDADLASVGLEDCLGERSVVVAEWPERCPHAFPEWTLLLKIEIAGEAERRFQAFRGTLPLPPGFERAAND